MQLSRRLAVCAVLTTAAVLAAACANPATGAGSPAPPASTSATGPPSSSTQPGPASSGASASAAPSERPAPGGVTTADQVFGAGCAKLPGGSAPGPTGSTPAGSTPAGSRPAGSRPAGPRPAGSTPAGPALLPGSLAAMATQPVVAALSGNPLLSSLGTVVRKADQVAELNAEPGITVFAPSDQAFAELRRSLGTDGFNALVADQNKVSELLKYWVLPRRYDRAALLAAATVSTVEGTSLSVSSTGSGMAVTDGTGQTIPVRCGNIPTANATVFIVDSVPLRQRP